MRFLLLTPGSLPVVGLCLPPSVGTYTDPSVLLYARGRLRVNTPH
jgi:hypothetical protein